MREMKDSGIEWIGKVPSHWDLIKLKYVATKIERGTAPIYVEDNGLMVVNQATFSRGNFDKSNIRFSSKPANTSRGLLQKEDVLLASTGGGVLGKTYYFNESDTYVADSHVTVVRTVKNELHPKLLFYCFSVNYDTFNATMAVGSTNQTELQRDLLINMGIPVPPLSEQYRITAYLDRKCAEIDTLTADIETQIETLEQYKRSVITEAVTKGLNPDAEMKDSGIEYVGDIPVSWTVHPLYCYFGERKHKNNLGKENNLLSLSYGDIIHKDINSNEGLLPESFNTYNIIEAGDIIVRPTDLQNDKRSLRTGLAKEHGIITSAYIALKAIRPLNTAYYHYLLHAFDTMKVFYNMGDGVRQGLNFSEFSRLMVFEPSLDEQNAIVKCLDSQCQEIDSLIADKRTQLNTLAEYKKSLIYEYVTGKKEVPAV